MRFPVQIPVLTALILLPVACAENPTAPARTPDAPTTASAALGRYLVTLTSGVDDPAGAPRRMAEGVGGRLNYVFREGSGRAFTVTLTPTAAEALRRDPHVAQVRQMEAAGRIATVESPAPWGLDRIDQITLPLSHSFDDYYNDGAGVVTYVIDTGIELTHPQFGGRARLLLDLQQGDGSESGCPRDPGTGRLNATGHGTHVAGIVASATYGVAKADTVASVRVASCGGTFFADDLARGIDAAVTNHQLRNAATFPIIIRPSVINISLSFPGGRFDSPHVDSAVARALRAGITVVVGAAYPYDTSLTVANRSNACFYTPSRVPGVITVAATDSTDTYAPTVSNEGPCVDLFAPGVDITSVGLDGGTAVMSGSSQATPFAAGVAARYLGTHPGASPDSVQTWIKAAATPSVVVNPGTAPNRLLFSPNVTVRRRVCCAVISGS